MDFPNSFFPCESFISQKTKLFERRKRLRAKSSLQEIQRLTFLWTNTNTTLAILKIMPHMLFVRFKWHTTANATKLHPVQFKLILGLQTGFLTQCFQRNWLKEQTDILNCETFPTTCISSKIKILLPADLTLRRPIT